jgi:hypothetical protein
MSAPPQVRRQDKLMSQAQAVEVLAHGFCGRLATGGGGWLALLRAPALRLDRSERLTGKETARRVCAMARPGPHQIAAGEAVTAPAQPPVPKQ